MFCQFRITLFLSALGLAVMAILLGGLTNRAAAQGMTNPLGVLPVATLNGQVFLPLVTGGAGQPDETPQLSSIQLVKQAENAGQLTYEQGLVHRVQAVVGNPALPARYVRGNLGLDGSTTLAEAVAKFDMIPA
ncbi:MAG: hypothetical protein KJZ93_15480 [Caldilineaceae bacterium]|nr:hypothetical protein [Caldilineaceae bacterium]